MSCVDLLREIPLPRMCAVRQRFDGAHIETGDIPAAVLSALAREGTLDRIGPGMRVAISGGSRGISNIALILKVLCQAVQRRGASPFIVPAMGSHGGATAEGQVEVLRTLGVTEQYLGFPILSDIEPVSLGTTASGAIAMFDRNAYEADATIVVNRIKEHPAFVHRVESGLCKMIVIGLGKQRGADQCHRTHIHMLGPLIEEIASYTLPRSNIVFGLGILENAYDETCELHAIPAEKILEEEPVLLRRAKALMPAIYPAAFDVLILDEIGKNICGAGFDTKVVGRFPNPDVPDTGAFLRMAILRLTEQTHGNAMGISNADVCTARIVDEMDREQSYLNSLTSLTPFSCKVPMYFSNDKLVIQAAIKMCPDLPSPEAARVVRIHNTRTLGQIFVSENMLASVAADPRMEILSEPQQIPFDENDNIIGL